MNKSETQKDGTKVNNPNRVSAKDRRFAGFVRSGGVTGLIVAGWILVMYGLLYWGYHTSRLPYWFDNFVQETGVWRVFGAKSYGFEKLEGVPYLVDPRLALVNDVSFRIEKSGYIIQKDNPFIVVSRMEGTEAGFDLSGEFSMSVDSQRGAPRFCPTCTIDDLYVGDWVLISLSGSVAQETGSLEPERIHITKITDE